MGMERGGGLRGEEIWNTEVCVFVHLRERERENKSEGEMAYRI